MSPKKTTKSPHDGLRVLFADDETHLQDLIAAELPRMGHSVTVCPDGTSAIQALETDVFDCVLVDLDMPGANGIEVIEYARKTSPEIEAVVLTGKGSTQSAIAALRLGAFDYLQKPCKLVDLKNLLQRVQQRRELNRKIAALTRRLDSVEGAPVMIASHRSMQRVRALIEKVAPTDSTVLVRGETGTGKELVARSVHEQSLRAEKPFVTINCGALPENLIESELFGHRKGAFTGAEEHRQGLFEIADGGTLFLDEIGELPLAVQSKLLRVLENGEVRRVGDNQPFQVDVRLVCATHRDLPAMAAAGEFREDLMYRINTFEILLPPLRDRKEDIPALAEHFLRRFLRKPVGGPLLTDEAVDALTQYPWPGNIRELANVLERAAILNDGLPIDVEDLPGNVRRGESTVKLSMQGATLKDIEMQAIHMALDRAGGNKTAAAEQLGISLKTLYNKLNQEAMRRAA